MPIMPWINDTLYVGGFTGLVLVARQALVRYDLKLSGMPGVERLRRPFGRGVGTPARTWSAPVRTSGNTAFDEWRDGEIGRIEAQRRALEARLQEFEDFVDKLRRAKDRATFERFVAEHPGGSGTVIDDARSAGHNNHRPA